MSAVILDRYDTPSVGRDYSDAESTGGLPLAQLEAMMRDTRSQPNWRQEADRCADYYDGNQLTQDQLAEYEQRRMAPVISNLVRPTVDVVLGMEAKTRTDWRVIADDDEAQEVAEGLSAKLHEAEREGQADRACSDAYAGEIKAGLHWVEVSRNSNPFAYPYRVRAIHRREIWWDWRATEPDLSDARYLIRRRWFDEDQTIAYFPKHKDLIRGALDYWGTDWVPLLPAFPELAQSREIERASQLMDYEWRDSERRRVCIFEVWYRTWNAGKVIRLPDGRVVEFQPKNMLHALAVAKGIAYVEEAVFPRVRCSWWIGPHRIHDYGIQGEDFPYVPFWGYREDLTGVPYGIIRAMLSPQDEINARRSKMLWLLSAKRVLMDSDALDTTANSRRRVLSEIGRPDAMIVLNPARKHQDGFKVDDQVDLGTQQFQVLQEAKQSLQESAGVYQAMLGDTGSGANSGIAINSLVEQGLTTLAEINDNYRFARRKVGGLLLNLIREDMKAPNIKVTSPDNKRKTFILNKPAVDEETGIQFLENDVQRTKVRVALEDVPQTPAYRAQLQQMLSETMKGMPPELQAILAPFWIESTELPKRKEIADLLRKQLGIQTVDPQDMTPEERAAFDGAQAKMQEQEQMAKKAMQLDIDERQAKVDKMRQDTERAKIDAAAQIKQMQEGDGQQQMRSEYEQKISDIGRTHQEAMDALAAEVAALRQGFAEEKLALTIKADNATQQHAAAVRVAELEKERDVEVARLAQAQDAVVANLKESLAKLKEEMAAKIAAEVERLAKKLDERPEPEEKEPPEPPEITVNVGPVVIEQKPQKGKKIKITKGKDGNSMTAEVEPEDED